MGEKHDVFLSDVYKKPFNAKQLLSSESDASSFPNGGLRTTSKAKGNCVWDPQSLLTIVKTGESSYLRIPSVFIGWSGEALDYKTPLLRSEEALNSAMLRVTQLLGDKKVDRVNAYAGLEQEFFLINREDFDSRPDLVSCGRTLVGAEPRRGQRLSDNYYGSHSTKVQDTIYAMEQDFWRLAIPSQTRHSEVAPSQYEIAPRFQLSNQANDNNMLMMYLMKEIAKENQFVCLFDEKPFANLNGSGKHTNWSFGANNASDCFFSPSSPYFMLATAAFVRAIHLNAGLLRASTASASNDHRLGGFEAPPGIISVNVTEEIQELINRCIAGEDYSFKESTNTHNHGVSYLPSVVRDGGDRNRTSPISFCGNRFEVRATGSSANAGWPITILNTITADSLNYIADKLEEAPVTKQSIQKILANVFSEHKDIIFNGNNYTKDWIKEAQKRGLPNAADTPSALAFLETEQTRSLFSRTRVLSESELSARHSIFLEKFNLDVQVEINVLIDMVNQFILPSCFEYLVFLKSVPDLEIAQLETIKTNLTGLQKSLEQLTKISNKLQGLDDKDAATLITKKARPAMNDVRKFVDTLELVVAQKFWPFPSYQDLLSPA